MTLLEQFKEDYKNIDSLLKKESLKLKGRKYTLKRMNLRDYVSSAFTWNKSSQGHNFWSLISAGYFEEAKRTYPQYFKVKFKNGVKTVKNGLL